jgi:hypothetical protein
VCLLAERLFLVSVRKIPMPDLCRVRTNEEEWLLLVEGTKTGIREQMLKYRL